MTSLLPVAAIRAAIRDGDWDAAQALITGHEAELRAAFADGSPLELECRRSWLDLLGAQRAMIEELRSARDHAARELERLGRDRRGVNAYLQR